MIAPVVDAVPEGAVVADVRWYLDGRSGREAYERGHLPGAVFVDLDRWLAGPPSPEEGRHPLPDPAVFADGMAGVGIGDDDVVVAYDDAGGVVAARLVWMLRATGHEAALLDGGMTGRELVTGAEARPSAIFSARPWPQALLASIDDAASPAHVVLDARDRERWAGVTEPIDPRPGHIPGARSLPCRENVGPDGRFLPADELRRRFEAAGVSEESSVVSYCGSGVNACHNLLALELAGFPAGRLYAGSYSQWSHTDRPVGP